MKSVRGAFIVVEGCDRSGKTTQCKRLVSALNHCNIPAEYMNFPDRSTPVGRLINDYLTKKEDFPDKTIHLLFSANRWELVPKIEKLLQEGTTVVVDRYAYSGVAFSAIKPGMDLEWCKRPDDGLPKPDLVLLLTLTPSVMAARAGYGTERYEQGDIQAMVGQVFKNMKDATWKEIDANKSVEELHEELLRIIKDVVEQSKTLHLGKFCGEMRSKLMEDNELEAISILQPDLRLATKRIRLWEPRLDQQNSLQRMHYINRLAALPLALAANSYFHSDRQRKDEIIMKITKIDNEINNIKLSFEKLKIVKERLEGSALKCDDEEQPIRYQSTASRIYAENKKKADDFQKSFQNLKSNLSVELPIDQCIINDVLEKNKQSHCVFKGKLQKYLLKKKNALELKNMQTTDMSNKNMIKWHKKLDEIEASAERKTEQEEFRQLFEKVFPIIRENRIGKERSNLMNEATLEDELSEIRSKAVIPPALLDSDTRKFSYHNTNDLIRDFPKEYRQRNLSNLWTNEEKDIFKEKFLLFPKEFGKISTFLTNKSVSDCVEYYYHSKKDENYKRLLRKSRKRKRDSIFDEPEDPMASLFNSVTGVMTRQQREQIRRQQDKKNINQTLRALESTASKENDSLFLQVTKPKPLFFGKNSTYLPNYSYDS